ncbi:MAG: hypothetical protein AAF488_12490, partial [Planctomycetota bacterium]
RASAVRSEASPTKDPRAVAEGLAEEFRCRLDHMSLSNARIRVDDDGTINVEIPQTKPEEIDPVRDLLLSGGDIAFALVAPDEEQKRLEYHQRMEMQEKEAGREPHFVVRPPVDAKEDTYALEGRSLRSYPVSAAHTIDPNGKPAIAITLTPEDGKAFSAFTEKNLNRKLAILWNDRILTAPTIRSRISQKCQITGDFTHDQVQRLVAAIDCGSLSVQPKFLEQKPLDPAEPNSEEPNSGAPGAKEAPK